MKRLAGIIGTVALGLTLAAGLAFAQSSTASYGYGGWNCPWASGAQANWDRTYTDGTGNTVWRGSHARRAAYSGRGNGTHHRHGPRCDHGTYYGRCGW